MVLKYTQFSNGVGSCSAVSALGRHRWNGFGGAMGQCDGGRGGRRAKQVGEGEMRMMNSGLEIVEAVVMWMVCWRETLSK